MTSPERFSLTNPPLSIQLSELKNKFYRLDNRYGKAIFRRGKSEHPRLRARKGQLLTTTVVCVSKR